MSPTCIESHGTQGCILTLTRDKVFVLYFDLLNYRSDIIVVGRITNVDWVDVQCFAICMLGCLLGTLGTINLFTGMYDISDKRNVMCLLKLPSVNHES